jgi:hypothetical protein
MVTFADKPEEISDFTQSIEDIQGKLVYTVPKGRRHCSTRFILASAK